MTGVPAYSYKLEWVKTEAGITTPGERAFWCDESRIHGLVSKLKKELREVGGHWTFTLKNAKGEVVHEPQVEPAYLR